MLKFLKDKKKDNKGFTLVELVIVVAILAILVGILAPQYTKYVEKSRKAADASNLENLVTAFKTAASDGDDQVPAGLYTITIAKTAANNNSTTTTLTSTNVAATSLDKVKTVIASYAGTDWQNTALKSSKWEDESGTILTSQAISAEIEVKNDGSVTVTYSPTTVKDQVNQNKE